MSEGGVITVPATCTTSEHNVFEVGVRTILNEVPFSRQMLPDTITSRISQTFDAQYRCLCGFFSPLTSPLFQNGNRPDFMKNVQTSLSHLSEDEKMSGI